MTAISVHLESEQGERLASAWDRVGAARLVQAHQPDTTCVRFIDLYGDTVFNRGQSAVLREEWAVLAEETPPELAPWVQSVMELIERCASEVHLYVRFSGD